MILYFSFGILNVCLLFLFIYCYKRNTGIDLENKDNGNMIMNIITFILSGPFGTLVLIALGLFLFWMWRKYYRKK